MLDRPPAAASPCVIWETFDLIARRGRHARLLTRQSADVDPTCGCRERKSTPHRRERPPSRAHTREDAAGPPPDDDAHLGGPQWHFVVGAAVDAGARPDEGGRLPRADPGELHLTAIAALVTIIGYSLKDNHHRMREN